MSQSTLALAPTLVAINGKPTTTSIDVARHFGKQHRNVLQAIQNLLAQLDADHALNFQQMVFEVAIGSGATRKDPAYRLTRDGFTLLAMGFTGKKALQFKLAYIDAFNKMEADLLLPAPVIDSVEPDRIAAAMAGANAVAASVQQQVFAELLRGNSWRLGRWLLSFGFTHEGAKPSVRAIEDGAYIATLTQMARWVKDPGTLIESAELADLAAACSQRLAARMGNEARKAVTA